MWPDAGLVIFRMYSPDSIDFDVDLRELCRQQRLDLFCPFLGTIGRRLSKPVLMAPEGDDEHPVLGFQPEVDRVVLLADPVSEVGDRPAVRSGVTAGALVGCGQAGQRPRLPVDPRHTDGAGRPPPELGPIRERAGIGDVRSKTSGTPA